MFQIRRMASVAAVAAEDAIDHGTDNGNAIAGASTIAVAITGAAVVDRAAAVVSAAAVIAAAAGPDDNTTATGVATRISATGGASHRVSATATSGKGVSAAAAMTAWMAGSQRIRRHWHATQRDRGREGDESFFVKHVILLRFKQKFVCDCTDNARSRPRVARQRDTFACQAATRFALIAHLSFSGHVLVAMSGLVGMSGLVAYAREQFCTDSTRPSDYVHQHLKNMNYAAD
jgi:hypothetical protein